MARKANEDVGLTWQGVEVPRVPPGDYLATCIGWQGPDWLRNYQRWGIRLEFFLIAEQVSVSAFISMGTDPAGARPQGRRSFFYAAWTIANGGPPRNGQRMSLETFTEPHLIYRVRVADSVKDGKDRVKPEAMRYSIVTEILDAEGH